jgi:hypothetical protein
VSTGRRVSVIAGTLGALAMSAALTGCLGGPIGDPGTDRLRLLQADPVLTQPLPAGYKVVTLTVTPAKWNSNGWPFGQPGWEGLHIDEMLRTTAPLPKALAMFTQRAKSSGWQYAPPPASWPPIVWEWVKRYPKYTAILSFRQEGPPGNYHVLLSAPPNGPTD